MPSQTAATSAATAAIPSATPPPFGELRPKESFQDLILTLQRFWGAQGCVVKRRVLPGRRDAHGLLQARGLAPLLAVAAVDREAVLVGDKMVRGRVLPLVDDGLDVESDQFPCPGSDEIH